MYASIQKNKRGDYFFLVLSVRVCLKLHTNDNDDENKTLVSLDLGAWRACVCLVYMSVLFSGVTI